MSIMFVITRLDEIGGAQIHVRDLATALLADGEPVTVVTGATGPMSEGLRAAGADVVQLPGLIRAVKPRSDVAAVRELSRVLVEKRPKVVSCHSSKAGAIGRLAARHARTPCIFTAHGWAFTDGVPFPQRMVYGAIEAALVPLAAAIVTVSQNDLQLAQRWLPHSRSRLHLIHNGVHDVGSTLMADPSSEPASGVFVGRFGPQKDHELALQAVAAVPGARLRLVGGGPGRPAVESRVRSMGLEGRVEVVGERDDVAQLLASSQFFVLLSRWEGLPRSVIEAMRAGLPVVASDVGGTSELVEHGRTGFLVPRGDLARATEAIEALVGSPALRRRMGSAGRSRYERCFRFDRVLRETRAIYELASGAGT